MALKKGLSVLLKSDPDISAVVGTRVRVNRIPKGSDYPNIVIRYVASEYINALNGTNATQMRRVQVDCWGNTPKEADELAQMVHNKLDGFRGVLSEASTILSCLPVGDVDLVEEETNEAHLAVDFNIWFTPGDFVVGVPADFADVDLDLTDEDWGD